jgi:aspartate-semialdehyde dehydrogenase
MPINSHTIAIAGASGAVGREVLGILERRGHPPEKIRALGSFRSTGSTISYGDASLKISELTPEAFDGCQVAIFATPSETSRRFVPEASRRGLIVVDNSSAFRQDPSVPLVVPEVNPEALGSAGNASRVAANPNCSTILLVVATSPLRRAFGIDRLDVATYQAVSGAGAAAIDELLHHTREALHERSAEPRKFHEPCAFNVFSHDSAVDVASGLNVEEQKMIRETRRIWNDESVAICPTCVRVPVVRAHVEAVTITLARPAREADVRQALATAPGLIVIDERAENRFPTSRKATGQHDVLVGRIRPDPSETPTDGAYRRYSLLLAGDQLLKGAAWNAVQLADLIASR